MAGQCTTGADPNQPDADPTAPDADPTAPDAMPGAPDATPGAPDASPDELCTTKYGTSDSFLLCSSTPTQCEFYVRTNEDTCINQCAKFAGTCIESYDSSGACNPTPSLQGCTPVHGDQVCICSLP